ncbi:site-specific recombinase, phage integrase family [Gleimia coleocanis DSM 15436]|uniref:Site-specific recombinase, phage integrase family n=1 Tax=Gleimia coleocanis DSM 15436 TaxID=525245 RepID=C0W0M5_9ACTO|nr:site-specific integrase [Gleimia coleocanis]EEH64084.1 site-specific recombinase, phage integrase family [Gleimia coleocanis DSM 15436]
MARNSFGSIRKLASGRFQARYFIPGTLERINAPTTFATKTSAKAWLAQQQADLERGEWKHPDQIKAEAEAEAQQALADALTLDEFAYQWFSEEPLAKSSLRAMESQWRNHITPHLGATPIKQLTHQMVGKWLESLFEAGKSKGVRKPCYNHLRRVLNEAVDRDIIPFNPITGKKYLQRLATKEVKADRERQPRKAYPVHIVRTVLGEAYPKHQAMLWLLAVTGLRSSELRALKRGSLDFTENTLSITQAVTGTGKNTDYRNTTKSEAGTRIVPIAPEIMRIVKAHCETVGALSADAYIFPKKTNPLEPMPGTRPYEALLYTCKRLGIPPIKPHELRHTVVTLVETFDGQGYNRADVKSYIGHSKGGDITLRYTHSDLDRKRLIAQLVYDALAGVQDTGNVVELKHAR